MITQEDFDDLEVFLKLNIDNQKHAESILLKLQNLYSNRELKKETYISEELIRKLSRNYSRRGVITEVVVYLSIFREEVELTNFDDSFRKLEPYFELAEFNFYDFADILFTPKRDEWKFIKTKRRDHAAQHLFYSIFDLSYESLGLDGTLKLFTEYSNLNKEKHLNSLRRANGYEDSKHIIEVLMEVIDYCRNNSDYPIEWSLTQAFLKFSQNESQGASNG